jgi:hypothetical protein
MALVSAGVAVVFWKGSVGSSSGKIVTDPSRGKEKYRDFEHNFADLARLVRYARF